MTISIRFGAGIYFDLIWLFRGILKEELKVLKEIYIKIVREIIRVYIDEKLTKGGAAKT
jgi:hypothetical protein